MKVTVLGDVETVHSGRTVNFSGKGMGLVLESAVPVGAPVRVDLDGSLLLGEVSYCHVRDRGWVVGLRLEQVLTLSDELSRLMRRLVEESQSPAPAPVRPTRNSL